MTSNPAEPLPLDSPRWGELRHAYREASDVPDLLRRLEAVEPDSGDFARAWNDAWSCLCHQGTIYTASYAAAPHLARIAEHYKPEHGDSPLALMIHIEAERADKRYWFHNMEGGARPYPPPPIPQFLEEAYSSSIGKAREIASRNINNRKAGRFELRTLFAFLSLNQSKPDLCGAFLEPSEEAYCPSCKSWDNPVPPEFGIDVESCEIVPEYQNIYPEILSIKKAEKTVKILKWDQFLHQKLHGLELQRLLGAVAVLHGHPKMGSAIYHLPKEMPCSQCGEMIPLRGFGEWGHTPENPRANDLFPELYDDDQ